MGLGRTLNLVCLVAATGLAPAVGVPADAPPRTINDITRFLEQFAPDPAAAERAREVLRREPPASGLRMATGQYWLERGQAAASLGRVADTIESFRRAREQFQPGDRLWLRATDELAIAEWLAGNHLNALRASEEIIRFAPVSMQGFALSSSSAATALLAQLGDFAAAQETLRRVESLHRTLVNDRRIELWHRLYDASVERARATLFETEGRWPEAEAAFRKALHAVELDIEANRLRLARGFETPSDDALRRFREGMMTHVVLSLLNLGRLAEAELVSREALKSALQRTGRASPNTARQLNLLAAVLAQQGRTGEAITIAREGLRSAELSGAAPEANVLERSRRNLAAVLVADHRYAEAIPVFEAMRTGMQTDPELARLRGTSDLDWAIALLKTGQAQEARRMIEAILERITPRFRPEDLRLAWVRGFHGVVLAATGERTKALEAFRVALPPLLGQARDDIAAESGNVRRAQRLAIVIEAYIGLLADAASTGAIDAGPDPVGESFRLAEAARGGVVQQALSASAARATLGDPALADLARRDQDARRRIVALTEVLTRLTGAPPAQQLPKIMGELRRDIDALAKTQGELRRAIERRFPEYADLTDPEPASVGAVQQALRPGEVLVSIYVAENATYVWAVPKSGRATLARAAVGAAEMTQTVTQLRRALEPSVSSIDALPQFDVALAASLYERLLKPSEPTWKGSAQLFLVPHGALAQLPFAVLPTAPFADDQDAVLFDRYRKVPWLARGVAIAQLPTASTLITLRRVPVPPPSARPFVGFGDPLFTKAAGPLPDRVLPLRSAPRLQNLDSADLAALPSLPDTAEEIREMAKALGADPVRDVFLREAASEKTIAGLNLSEPRVIAFATHGLVPGDLNGLTQPALALSAPEVAVGDDDGLLTMEEILGLKLNAEWVVLSACNTAAGAGAGAEAVSGLGRAFFYAGARALLVSHWPVESRAARALMVDTFQRYAKDEKREKARALRDAMLAMIDGEGYVDPATGKPLYRYAHPLFWAPFVVVGD